MSSNFIGIPGELYKISFYDHSKYFFALLTKYGFDSVFEKQSTMAGWSNKDIIRISRNESILLLRQEMWHTVCETTALYKNKIIYFSLVKDGNIFLTKINHV